MARPAGPRDPTRALIVVLPLLLLVAAVVLAARATSAPDPVTAPPGQAAVADGRPLAVPPVDAPDASGPACARLLAALPPQLPADPAPLPRRALADPVPAGALAWVGRATDDGVAGPVVLRCGLPRPAELVPGAPLLQVDGVVWLTLSQPDRDTFVSVDRPTYVALTVPRGLGSGPLQTVSQVIRTALPTG